MRFHRSELARTPTNACRIPLFAPTRRPQAVTEWRVETSWGWAVITGKLGQQHRDVLDAARMVAEREEWTADGHLHLLVDPAKLRSALGGDATNNERVKCWLRDLRAAEVVTHIVATGKTTYGGVISEFDDARCDIALSSRPGAFESQRRMLRISFGSGWSKLVEEDREMRYPLWQVVRLTHGFSQAVARFCLSHNHVNDDVAGLMVKVAGRGETRKRRAELESDKEGLAALGIEVSGNRVTSGRRKQSPVSRKQSPVSGSKVR